MRNLFTVSVVMLATTFVANAAEPFTLTKHASPSGEYLYAATEMADPDIIFSTYKMEDNNRKVTFYLIDKDMNTVRTFTINNYSYHGSDDYDYPSFLEDAYTGSEIYANEYLVTQHLFNKDDLCEVIFGCVEEYFDEESGQMETRGIQKVYNEKGEFVGSLPYNGGAYYRLFRNSGITYLYDEYADEDGSIMWSINKEGSEVKAVSGDSAKLGISPNPAPYESTVTVTLPAGTQTANAIIIFDTEGRKLHYSTIGANANSIGVPAYKLATGINLVNILGTDGEIIATGKIIRE